jgi:hypothetical protein
LGVSAFPQNFLVESAGNVGARKLEQSAQALYLAAKDVQGGEMSNQGMLAIVEEVEMQIFTFSPSRSLTFFDSSNNNIMI